MKTMTTIRDLFESYEARWQERRSEVVLSEFELAVDFDDWCRAHGRPARYEVSGALYLHAADGAHSEAALSSNPRPLATLDLAAAAGERDGLEFYRDLKIWLARYQDPSRSLRREALAACDDPLEPDHGLLTAVGVEQVAKSWGLEPGTAQWRAALAVYNREWRRAVRGQALEGT